MDIGISILLIIAIPTLFQVVMLGNAQKKRHAKILEQLSPLEQNEGSSN